ncbi:MAG: hypothetical protein GY679_02940 [Mycoplasma sp.]|nr:hypothetical protein [Mycoplasma sp.]
MNLLKEKRKIQNLLKIYDIIEVSKFSTINELNKSIQISETAFEMAFMAKSIFELAKTKYKITNKFISNNKNKINVWVFATLPSTLLSITYDKYIKIIEKSFKKEEDIMIAIGDTAQSFAKAKGYKVIFEDSKMKDSSDNISSVLSNLFMNNKINQIKFVLNSSKIENKEITILPLDKLNIKRTKQYSLDPKIKFYPSMVHSLDATMSIYISRITDALIKEGEYFYLKEKLLRHESSLKSIKEKIKQKTKQNNKIKRKIETEEMIFISQNAKRNEGQNE